MALRWALGALLASASAAMAIEPEAVTFAGRDGVTLQAVLYRPALSASPGSSAPGAAAPAIVALHGCGGNFRAGSRQPIARVPDWSERFVAAGYVVLWPDSFGSRGLGSQCQVANRTINPAKRVGDAVAAADWLAQQPGIDKGRVVLIGWSHGGSTVLRTVTQAAEKPAVDFKLAVAFYPGCRPIVERDAAGTSRAGPWSSRLPLTVVMGGADDWTPPEPCRDLGSRPNVRYIEYPGAYHDFDAPDLPVRVRSRLTFTANGSGQAHVGTDPAARAAAITEVMALLQQAAKH